MNSVLMQGTGPVASMTGSPTPATGDFLAVLADALAPSVPPEVSNVAALAPELIAAPSMDATTVTRVPSNTTTISVTVPPAEAARSAAIAYAATDVVVEAVASAETPAPVPIVALASDAANSSVAVAASIAAQPELAPMRRADERLDVWADTPNSVADAPNSDADPGVLRDSDPTGRMAGAADPVDEMRDESTPFEDRKDLASRQPVGAGVTRPTVDVSSPPLPQWNGRGPAEVAAAVRPAQGHASISRPGVHSAHGPVARPGWLPGALGAQALVVRGGAALQALGQYTSVGRGPGSQHVLPVTEQRATPVAAATSAATDAIDRAALSAQLSSLEGTSGDDADRPAAETRHGEHAAAVGDTAALERTPSPVETAPTTSNVVPNGAAAVRPGPIGPVGAAIHRTPHPGGLGMIGTDRVDRVRQQTAGRPVQRLTVDLDNARVAVRVRGERVSVDVLSDPAATLGQTWAHDVERTLETAMRAQEASPGRLPVERDRVSTGQATGHDHRSDRHHGSGGDGRGEQSGREQRRAVPWWLTEDDE